MLEEGKGGGRERDVTMKGEVNNRGGE